MARTVRLYSAKEVADAIHLLGLPAQIDYSSDPDIEDDTVQIGYHVSISPGRFEGGLMVVEQQEDETFLCFDFNTLAPAIKKASALIAKRGLN